MTILDYLLLGAFLAAMIYTTYRLFLGWRYSAIVNASADSRENADATNLPVDQTRRTATGAPWHSRQVKTKPGLEI